MVDIAVNIKFQEKSYPIIIENEPIPDLRKKLFEYLEDRNYLVVISQKVEKLYGKLLDIPKQNKFILKDGEKEKNFKTYQKIINSALKLQLNRKGTIVAIGGGVAGDLAGFVASTYMRGIKFIQVPTTLLAAVDSSVGGKTAVDTGFGKNLVGTFYQPDIVFINPKFLKTLDERQYKSGLGEVVKYAFIEKSCLCEEEFNLINFLNENLDKINDRDEKILLKLIEICIKLKKSVVEKDEKENNLRRILNFGHTFAHAAEKITNYKYTHGEAVAQGIIFAFAVAEKNNLTDKNYNFLAQDLIKKFDFRKLPLFKTDRLLKIMQTDKKADKESIRFVLPVDYSKVEIFDFPIKVSF